MSIASFTSNKQGVQDLLAALPAPAVPVTDRSRNEDFGQDAKPGFNDLLRDSAESQQKTPQRSETAEPVDAQPRAESQQSEQANTDKPQASDQDKPVNESGDGESQESSGETKTEQDAEQAPTDSGDAQPKDTTGEAQVQAAANAASAQLNIIDAVATDQPKAQSPDQFQPQAQSQAQTKSTQQLDLAKVIEVASGDQPSAQKSQSASANVLANGSLPTQSQSPNGPVVQVDAAATVQPVLQQGDSAQTSSGESGGEAKSSATTATTNATTSGNNNAAVTTAFAVPDQANVESRLPINTTVTAPAADAARVAQAQSAITTGDNDSLNTARLTRGLANAVQQRGGAVTLRLTPPEMGTVRIQMQITGTNVSASFHAESASAQTLLTTQLSQLRTALESKGMSVERLSVQPLAATAQSNNANQSQNQSDAQQQGQSQQQSAGDGRSRGQYSSDSSGQQSSDPQNDNGSGQQAPRGFFDRLNDASELQAD